MNKIVKSIETSLPYYDTIFENRKQLLELLKTHPGHSYTGSDYEFKAVLKSVPKSLSIKYISQLIDEYEGTLEDFCTYVKLKQREHGTQKWQMIRKKLS
jgi:hypothetical protein